MNVWRFDDTQWWMPPYPLPSAVDNIEVIESWSGYALRMQGDKPSGQADEDPRIVNSKRDSAGPTPLRAVAAVHDVVNGAGVLETQLAGHADTLDEAASSVNSKICESSGLTPLPKTCDSAGPTPLRPLYGVNRR